MRHVESQMATNHNGRVDSPRCGLPCILNSAFYWRINTANLSFLAITAQNIDHTLEHRRARLINLCLGVIRESEATTNLLANEIEQQGLVSVLGRAQDQNGMILCLRIRVNAGRGGSGSGCGAAGCCRLFC